MVFPILGFQGNRKHVFYLNFRWVIVETTNSIIMFLRQESPSLAMSPEVETSPLDPWNPTRFIQEEKQKKKQAQKNPQPF